MPRENTLRRRGRPKTTGASANAEELRREQIRSAQRAYRLRRDNRIRDLEEAHEALKAKCRLLEEALLELREEAGRCASCEPLAGMVLRRTTQFLDVGSSEGPESSPRVPCVQVPSESEAPSDSSSGSPLTFGYLLSDTEAPRPHDSCANASQLSESASTPLLISLPPPRTHSPQETTFARCLHRLTLEHAYLTFTTPSSPHSVYRTFRLVPCFKDRAKMEPYFARLLRSEAGKRLELYGLPFYCIGGAGRHYPRPDGEVMNLRFPRRIVGLKEGHEGSVEGYEERLKGMGYGGVWFDSYEVECYLRERGIWPLAHSSVIPVRRTSTGEGERTGQSGLQALSPSGETESPEGDSVATTGRYFDVDRFLECLYPTASILGRAPGFRKDSVDAAITYALRRA